MTFDGKAFGEEIVSAVKSHVSAVVGPVLTRLDALEKQLADMPVPKDGKDADEDAITARVSEKMAGELAELREAVEAIEPAPELPDIAGMIKEAIDALPEPVSETAIKSMLDDRISAIPEPETVNADAIVSDMKAYVDGKSAEIIERIPAQIEPEPLPDIAKLVNEAVAAIPAPEDGKDADPEEIRAAVADEVQRAVATLPAPKDGKSVTIDDVRPLIEEAVSKSVASIATIKDGFIDREGSLVFTMSDGSTKNFGKVVGRDGSDADMPALEKLISEKVAAIPTPKDGEDGVGFDDMTCEVRADGVYLVWEKGEIVKEARLPVPIDRGVFKSGETYVAGNCVTWGGSAWICQKDTSEKPGDGDAWRLAVKKGRDGKDKA